MSDRSHVQATSTQERHINLYGATGIGVGAIVGGGILVLAGVALRATGPSAILAFALNGFIALLTAFSFAELSTSFPESGGSYAFARKVLGMRAAFVVGWILWFAYIVAGVLYALGFAEYFLAGARALWPGSFPAWLESRAAVQGLALLAAGFYTLGLIRRASGGGQWATWGKVAVFLLLILAGAWAILRGGPPVVSRGLSPFMPEGGLGVIQAMGFTFIALQGFEIIGAVGGEVKEPGRTIPRAMLYSLGLALLIYLPLLFVVSTAGVPSGDSIQAMSEREPETVMALAVGNFMGPLGFWFVTIAAILSTLSALQANILAASRVAFTMARDRTLPPILGQIHAHRSTPITALYATTLALAAILLMVPDLASAGAAASLIFLVCFALGHAIALLARGRSGGAGQAYRAPGFPYLPLTGGALCIGLALFQAVAVPAAGEITLVWLGLGVLLFVGLFSPRASAVDASVEGRDPELLKLRGQNPAVLVPIANPANAKTLVSFASALAPPRVGQVLLLNVVNPTSEKHGDPIAVAQAVLGASMRASMLDGHMPQALLTVAVSPWSEIKRVAKLHHCHGILLGKAELSAEGVGDLEALVNSVECHVSFLFRHLHWSLEEARRIVVPIGGRSSHYSIRARFLGGLCRTGSREVSWLRVLPSCASEEEVAAASRQLQTLAADATPLRGSVHVIRRDEPVEALVEQVCVSDLLVLGMAERKGRKVFGEMIPRLVAETPCAVLVIGRGGEFEDLASLLPTFAGWLGRG